MNKIKLYKPYIGDNEYEVIRRVLRRGVLSRGTETESFENAFARFIGKKYAVAVSSGTAGLHLCIRAVGWKNGDEIITTPFSFIATANALLYEGIKPIFVDISEDYNIDVDKIEEKITPSTKGILLVHIFGLPANYKKIKTLAEKYKLKIIEDACEAIYPKDKNFTVGKSGIASVYGFYENKQMTSGGEGGMIVTNNKKFANLCRSMRDHGRLNKENWLNEIELGFNYRITEMQAAFGKEQLRKVKFILNERKRIAEYYNDELSNIENIKIPQKGLRSWFVYFVSFKNKKAMLNVINKLESNNIESKIYFPSMHLFAHIKKQGYKVGDFPNSEKASDTTIALPFFIDLKKSQIKFISNTIKEAL